MAFFVVGIILVLIGVLAISRGNASKFNTTSGGGSRIPPEAWLRLNESVQKVAGTKESTDSYFLKSNILKPNILGLIILVVGIVFIALSLI
ncbi:MAG: hypothetical protein QME45_11110 [Clostridiales bacterium]|nr:hypothetical protein [Clostridiales bacterium]